MRLGFELRSPLVAGVLAAMGLIAACGNSGGSQSATTSAAPGPVASVGGGAGTSSTIASVATAPDRSGSSPTSGAVVPTTPAPSTLPSSTAQVSGPQLEVDEGDFLGIGSGSPLADAVRILGVAPVVEHPEQGRWQSAPTSSWNPCLSVPGDHWSVYSQGLTLVFEGPSADDAKLTNWAYTGGVVAGYTEMIAPNGIEIGETRDDLTAAYGLTFDFGDSIDVDEQVLLRFGLNGDTIQWFGRVDCAAD